MVVADRNALVEQGEGVRADTRPLSRVLFLNSPEVMGADSRIHALLMAHLDRSRYQVHVACSAGSARRPSSSWQELARIPDLRRRRANFGPSFNGRGLLSRVTALIRLPAALMGLLRLAAAIRREGIEVIHASDRPRDAVACALLSRLSGARSVIHIHVKSAEWVSGPVRWAMNRADAIVGISDFVSGSVASNGFDARKVRTVLNAIDLNAWDPAMRPSPIREELGIPAQAPLLISVSRLIPWKGLVALVRAVAEVRAHEPDVRLIIVGADDMAAMDNAAPLSILLRALIDALGLGENVFLVGSRTDVPGLLAAADVFTLPSIEEPFGLVFLEAMAMMKPVVAINDGGTPEVVVHGVTGLLSAPGDGTGLAENILALIQDRHLRGRLGENGRRWVEEHFTAARMAQDMECVYDSLLAKGQGHRGLRRKL